MKTEVGYLFIGLWKGKKECVRGEGEEQRETERDRERERERWEKGRSEENRERQKLPLREKRLKSGEASAASRKKDLPASVDGRDIGQGLSLKGTGQIITAFPILKSTLLELLSTEHS